MCFQPSIHRFGFVALLFSGFLLITKSNPAQSSSAPPEGSQPPQATSSNSANSSRNQGQETSGQTIVNPDGSTVSHNHYKNRFFDFTLDFPQGWLLFNNKDAKAGMEDNKRKYVEAHPELAPENKPNSGGPLLVVAEATAYNGGTKRRTFKILANDASGEDPSDTGVDYLNFIERMSKNGKLPFEFLSVPRFVTINGKKLGKAYVKMPWEGQVWYAAMYALREKTYILQFIYVSPDREGLTEIENLIDTLRFGSQKAQP